MSQKPKKYPFFTRLKRAWAVYNEYMPTSTGTTDTNVYSDTRKKRLIRLKGESPRMIEVPDGKTFPEIGMTKHIAEVVKKKHTLIKKKDR